MLVVKKEEIKKRRENKGLSQRQLSFYAGLPVNAVFRLERKNHSFTYPLRAKAIADALECNIEDIFEEE